MARNQKRQLFRDRESTVETPLQHVQHPDLLLKHLDTTFAIYKRRQTKHLQYTCKKRMKHWE
jgi:hypothetical protein